jgi:hypothetical protein
MSSILTKELSLSVYFTTTFAEFTIPLKIGKVWTVTPKAGNGTGTEPFFRRTVDFKQCPKEAFMDKVQKFNSS